MASQMKVAVVHAIELLLERGSSQRRIAEVLRVDPGTMARYARRAREWVKRPRRLPGLTGQ